MLREGTLTSATYASLRSPLMTMIMDVNLPGTPEANRRAVGVVHAQTGSKCIYAYLIELNSKFFRVEPHLKKQQSRSLKTRSGSICHIGLLPASYLSGSCPVGISTFPEPVWLLPGFIGPIPQPLLIKGNHFSLLRCLSIYQSNRFVILISGGIYWYSRFKRIAPVTHAAVRGGSFA